jgi:hypothetical protein
MLMILFIQYLVCSKGDLVLTFDDLTDLAAVPNGYNNIHWTNAFTYTISINTNGYYRGIVSRNYTINKDSMTDAPRRHLLPRPKSSPNQNQNSLSVSSLPTPTSSSSSTPSPSTIRRASVPGVSVVLP